MGAGSGAEGVVAGRLWTWVTSLGDSGSAWAIRVDRPYITRPYITRPYVVVFGFGGRVWCQGPAAGEHVLGAFAVVLCRRGILDGGDAVVLAVERSWPPFEMSWRRSMRSSRALSGAARTDFSGEVAGRGWMWSCWVAVVISSLLGIIVHRFVGCQGGLLSPDSPPDDGSAVSAGAGASRSAPTRSGC